MDEGYDELQVAGLTLRGVARGGVQTCVMCPELDVMFDVGAAVPGQLKHPNILVTHGHMDHLGALPPLVSRRALLKLKPPSVHVPSQVAAPLERIFDAWAEIEGVRLAVDIVGHEPGDVVALGKSRWATCIRSVHRVPSLAWVVSATNKHLRPEYRGRSGSELRALRAQGVEVDDARDEDVLAVTGDTQIELWKREPRLRKVRVLVHEVTGWDERSVLERTRAFGHTHVDELLECVEQFEGRALVLVHRSPKHSRRQAERIVAERFPASVRDRVHVFGT